MLLWTFSDLVPTVRGRRRGNLVKASLSLQVQGIGAVLLRCADFAADAFRNQRKSGAKAAFWHLDLFCGTCCSTPWHGCGVIRGKFVADLVAGAALCGPGSANFVAGTGFCGCESVDFVAGAVFCKPRSADVVAGTAFCQPRRAKIPGEAFCYVEVQILWQGRRL